MILDSSAVDPGRTLRCDVCIVGGGAAGIALALELVGSRLAVILLEAGDRRYSKKSQAQYRGELASTSIHADAHVYRRRVWGGSTSIWGGRCVPFDTIDFEARDYVASSGWPFGLDHLQPYYARANHLCEAGDFLYTVGDAIGTETAEIIDGCAPPDLVMDRIERFSRPTDFAKTYGRRLSRAANVTVLLNGPCITIEAEASGEGVARVVAGQDRSRRFYVEAQTYVVAAGGLETTRLLMASDASRRGGFGNGSGKLGRYYMCHLENTLGRLFVKPRDRRIVVDFERTADGIYIRRKMSLSEGTQRSRGLLNTTFRFHHALIADPSHRDPILSAMFLVKSFVIPEYRRKIARIEQTAASDTANSHLTLLKHVRNMVARTPELASFSWMWSRRRIFASRKLPFVVRSSSEGIYPLDFNCEQAPNPDSRVMLSDRRDENGVPVIKLDWRTCRQDHESLSETFKLVQEAFKRSGCAELEAPAEGIDAAVLGSAPIGGHHIGTARMSVDPAEGVVDANCKVHGMRNLYVCGAACFPTSGHANPTLTIVALAVRLADRIKTIAAV